MLPRQVFHIDHRQHSEVFHVIRVQRRDVSPGCVVYIVSVVQPLFST